jgi:hypothetical protein
VVLMYYNFFEANNTKTPIIISPEDQIEFFPSQFLEKYASYYALKTLIFSQQNLYIVSYSTLLDMLAR